MERTKTNRRSKHLNALSDDHLNSMRLRKRIRDGIEHKVSTKRIVDYVIFSFERNMKNHLEQEDRLLISLVRTGDHEIKKGKQQQMELINVVNMIRTSTGSSEEVLLRFVDILERNIRFEERRLFPYIERNGYPDAFDRAARIITDLHSIKKDEEWQDEFWLEKMAS